MTTIVILLFILAIPLCRAITVSRGLGFRGCVGFAVWALEAAAREQTILAAGLRALDEGRKARRAAFQEAR